MSYPHQKKQILNRIIIIPYMYEQDLSTQIILVPVIVQYLAYTNVTWTPVAFTAQTPIMHSKKQET